MSVRTTESAMMARNSSIRSRASDGLPCRPDVEKAAIGIEADGAQRGKAVLKQQGVAEGEKGIDGVAGRPAVARFEIETALSALGLHGALSMRGNWLKYRAAAWPSVPSRTAGSAMWSRRVSRSAMSRAAGSSLPRVPLSAFGGGIFIGSAAATPCCFAANA